MNLLMNERNLGNWGSDAFRTPDPIVQIHHEFPATLRETRGKPLWREWVAHRTWEDDGGGAGQDRRRCPR